MKSIKTGMRNLLRFGSIDSLLFVVFSPVTEPLIERGKPLFLESVIYFGNDVHTDRVKPVSSPCHSDSLAMYQ